MHFSLEKVRLKIGGGNMAYRDVFVTYRWSVSNIALPPGGNWQQSWPVTINIFLGRFFDLCAGSCNSFALSLCPVVGIET